jgi:tol-pal system protein YbgF
MRRIKTYVVTLGVALCVAPIFNSAVAQQGNNSTQLLLQVQSMRQEIAELRDMVERQQFQLKRLQKQTDSQSKQLELAQSYGDTSSNSSYQPSYEESVPIASNALPVQATNSVPPINTESNPGLNATGPQSVVGQEQTESAPAPEQLASLSQESPSIEATTAANTNVDATTLTQAPVTQAPVIQNQDDLVQASQSSYPPVIDRSFRTTAADVQVTGTGSPLATSTPNQGFSGNQNSVSNTDVVYSAVSVANAANQQASSVQGNNLQLEQVRPTPLVNSTGVGVVSIPAQVGAQPNPAQILPSQITAEQVVAAQSAAGQRASAQINTGQTVQGQILPGQVTPGQVVAAQNATGQAIPAPALTVLSENDFYAQGFDLLKQSKYEEAALIFEQQLQAYPRSELADDAHYWIAEAMHVSRKLDVAKVHLKAIISDFPQSRRLPDAMLKTAYIEQSQGNQIEARILFQEIVNLHPQSDAAIAAKNQIAAVN